MSQSLGRMATVPIHAKYVGIDDGEAMRRAIASGYLVPALLDWSRRRNNNRNVRVDASSMLLELIDRDLADQRRFTDYDLARLRVSVSRANVSIWLEVVKVMHLAGARSPHDLDLGTILEHMDYVNLKRVRDGLAAMGRTCKARESDVLDLTSITSTTRYASFRPHNPLRSARGERAMRDARRGQGRMR